MASRCVFVRVYIYIYIYIYIYNNHYSICQLILGRVVVFLASCRFAAFASPGTLWYCFLEALMTLLLHMTVSIVLLLIVLLRIRPIGALWNQPGAMQRGRVSIQPLVVVRNGRPNHKLCTLLGEFPAQKARTSD